MGIEMSPQGAYYDNTSNNSQVNNGLLDKQNNGQYNNGPYPPQPNNYNSPPPPNNGQQYNNGPYPPQPNNYNSPPPPNNGQSKQDVSTNLVINTAPAASPIVIARICLLI